MLKRRLTAAALAVLMAAIPTLASTSLALGISDGHQQVAQAAHIAEQGFYALRHIQLSRLVLFQGQPDSAIKLVDEAAKLLADDSTD